MRKIEDKQVIVSTYACRAVFKPMSPLSLPHKLYFKYLKTKTYVIVAVWNNNIYDGDCFAFYLCCLVFRQNRCIGQGSFQCFCIFFPRIVLRTNLTDFLKKLKGALLNNGDAKRWQVYVLGKYIVCRARNLLVC